MLASSFSGFDPERTSGLNDPYRLARLFTV
jgi:hypothetical protein